MAVWSLLTLDTILMKFYSTRTPQDARSFREAVLEGLAPDGGLYVPESLPALKKEFWDDWLAYSPVQLATRVLAPYVKEDIPEMELADLLAPVVGFPFPLVEVEPGIHSLELFHGPTLAFKDVGATFLAQSLGYFARQRDQQYTVLVATSGDTGSAVANGFYNVEGTRVIILYPSGKVSASQEKQLTTYGGNITAVEVNGTFDDCQRLVKQSFMDAELKQKLHLTSANSINLARLLPQSLYYFLGIRQFGVVPDDLHVCVPSGNFGNITAGLYAQRMGLPIAKFVAATNANHVVPDYLQSGTYEPRSSVATLSNAMDVGAPSNFERLQNLFPLHAQFQAAMTGTHATDEATAAAMQEVYDRTGYLLDPHGAVGYLGLKEVLPAGKQGVFLETAHPAKFQDRFPAALQDKVEVPDRLAAFLKREKVSVKMEANDEAFRDFLNAQR